MDLEDDTEEFQDTPQPDQPEQPTTVNQPTLEVVVTDQQCTMTFNGEQVHICEEVILLQIQKFKIITKCKTENCVYTFSTYNINNINTFFTITINPTIG